MCLVPEHPLKTGERHLAKGQRILSKYPNSMLMTHMCCQDIYKLVTHVERYCSILSSENLNTEEVVRITILNGMIEIVLPPLLYRQSSDSWYLFQSIRRKLEDWKGTEHLSWLTHDKSIWIHFCNHFSEGEGTFPDSNCIELRRVVNAVSETLMVSDRATNISYLIDCKPDNWNGVQVYVMQEKMFRNHIHNYYLRSGNRY